MGAKTYPSHIPPTEVPALNGSELRVLPAFQGMCAPQADGASVPCHCAGLCMVSASSSVYVF